MDPKVIYLSSKPEPNGTRLTGTQLFDSFLHTSNKLKILMLSTS